MPRSSLMLRSSMFQANYLIVNDIILFFIDEMYVKTDVCNVHLSGSSLMN